MHRIVLTLALILVLATACTPFGSKQVRVDDTLDATAKTLLMEKEYAQAAQAYTRLALEHPQRQDHFNLLAADAWLLDESMTDAQTSLALVARDALNGEDRVRYDLIQAALALADDDAEQALRLVQHDVSDADPELATRVLKLKRDAALALDDHWQAATAAVALLEYVDKDERSKLESFINRQLIQLDQDELTYKMVTMELDDPMLPWIDKALDQLHKHGRSGRFDLQHVIEPAAPGALSDNDRVAVLLPLSGKGATAGKVVQLGLLSAYFQYENSGNRAPAMRFYDTHSKADDALEAYQQASADGASRILGPLLRSEVDRVLAHYDEYAQTPTMVLNHSTTATAISDAPLQFSLEPEQEGAQAASKMLDQGLRQAIILHDGSRDARSITSAFEQAYTQNRGSVIHTSSLDPSQVDYASDLRAIGLASQHADDTGIYLIMHAKQARLLMPQIRLARSRLPVFASSRIYAGFTNAIADFDLDGITYSDAPWLYESRPGYPDKDTMEQRLADAGGRSARLFAFGMDAFFLALHADALRQQTGTYMPGASGDLTINQSGQVQRALEWITYRQGKPSLNRNSLDIDAFIED